MRLEPAVVRAPASAGVRAWVSALVPARAAARVWLRAPTHRPPQFDSPTRSVGRCRENSPPGFGPWPAGCGRPAALRSLRSEPSLGPRRRIPDRRRLEATPWRNRRRRWREAIQAELQAGPTGSPLSTRSAPSRGQSKEPTAYSSDGDAQPFGGLYRLLARVHFELSEDILGVGVDGLL